MRKELYNDVQANHDSIDNLKTGRKIRREKGRKPRREIRREIRRMLEDNKENVF
ncbi:hypothetical protein LguiA_005559 [Lonicera macranthoides]